MPYPATPKTWVAGDVLTAAQLNAELRDALLAAFPLSVNAWTAWTPVVNQPGVITATVAFARYMRIGRLVTATFELTITGAGTAGNALIVTLPVAAADPKGVTGSAWFLDASVPTRYVLAASGNVAASLLFIHDTSAGNFFGNTPSLAIANGDGIRCTVTYEAAS